MILHTDFDNYHEETVIDSKPIPEKVESITVEHDGGRIFIYINGVEVYRNMGIGTRDCSIDIDNKEVDE